MHDWHVDVVTNEVVSLVTLQLIKLFDVDLRKLQGVLLRHLLLLRRHLLLHHLLLLLRHHLWLLTWGHLLVLVHALSHHHVGTFLLSAISLLLWATWLSVILVVATSSLALSASSASALECSSATASLVASEVLVAIVHLLALHLVIVRLLSHDTWSERLTLFALTLYEIYQLGNVVPLFLVSCLFQVILRLPEIDLEGLLVVAEAFRLIEKLDTFLGTFHVFVEDVSDLVACEFLTVVVDFVVFELDREDVSCLAELLFNFLLSDTLWNEFNIDVGFEHFLLVLHDWVQGAVFWLQFRFFLIYMWRNQNCLVIDLQLHVGLLNSVLC